MKDYTTNKRYCPQEIKWIKDYHRSNPNISICEYYGKPHNDKAYSRHHGSLYHVFVRLGFRKKAEFTKGKLLGSLSGLPKLLP